MAFEGEVISESLVGVTFFRRARFFVDVSRSSSGGLANSDGSKSRVFCTSNTVDGIIGSRFWPPRANSVEIADCDMGGGGARCWSCCCITDACAITDDVC